jgi:hypothetical protein
MIRLAILFCIYFTMFSAYGQSASKYQVGTITEVKTHQTAGGGASNTTSYDVSVKVGDTIYAVLLHDTAGPGDCEVCCGARTSGACGERHSATTIGT